MVCVGLSTAAVTNLDILLNYSTASLTEVLGYQDGRLSNCPEGGLVSGR